jgi:hypothetical protein
MRAIRSAVSCRRWPVAVLLPLVTAAMLWAGADGINGVGVGLGHKPNPSASPVHQVTSSTGTFIFENVQPGSYTIWAELPAGQLQSYSSHSTTITFTAASPGAANARMKPLSVSGLHVTNNTLRVTGALKAGVFFSEDFTISAPSTITGTISSAKGSELEQANSYSGGKALATGAMHCPPGTVLTDGTCVDPKMAAANVVNSGRSNIKNNLQLPNVDPSGPLSITAITCGANSVSVTTNYAAPAGSTWVFTNTNTGKATLFPPNQPVHGANSQLQFALNAPNGSYRLVIENSNGISILPKPYLFTCGGLDPAAVPGGQAH